VCASRAFSASRLVLHIASSELRVAQMAADGLSNPQIGQALFVTRNTVETHLRHIYQKLAIHSREDLSRTLQTLSAAGSAD
jgi:ATP/maltotriose-dependent transcriptional regulator MalT